MSEPRQTGIILVQFYVIGMLIVLAAVYSATSSTPESWIYAASVVHVLSCAWMLWSWRVRTGRLFDPYGIFLIAAMLFNGGLMLLEVLRIGEPGLTSGRVPVEIALKTIFLVTIGLACMHLGALFSVGAARTPSIGSETAKTESASARRSVRIIGWILFSIAFLPALFQARSAASTVMALGYFSLYQRAASIGLDAAPQVLTTFLVPAIFFLLAGSQGSGASVWVARLGLAFYVSTNFFFGYRAGPATALVAFAWLWHRGIRPLPMRILIPCGLVLMFIVFPVIFATRNISGEQRLTWEVVEPALRGIGNPFVASVGEMGYSMWTVAYTVYFVPAIRPFDYGMSYVYAVFRLFPNLFWSDVHPAAAEALSLWLITTVDPVAAQAGAGLAYSFIAEAYANFGWIGGLFLLFLMGLALGRVVRWLDGPPDPARLACIASALAFFLVYARGDMAMIIRGVVWYALLPYAAARVLGMLRPRIESPQSVSTQIDVKSWT